jgi:hypothetical protein
MAEQGSKVKGCGKHVDQELNIESSTTFASGYTPIESRTDRSPPRHQHLLSNHSRERRIERHVRNQSRKRFSHCPAKGGQQSSHRRLQILAKGAGIGRGLSPELGDHGIRNQVALAGPAAI